MRYLTAGLLLCVLWGLNCLADSPSYVQPVTTTVQKDPGNPINPEYLATVMVAGNRFGFVLPDGFRFGAKTGGKLQINNEQMGAFITFAVAEGTEPGKNEIVERYHKGRLVDSFMRPIFGRMCESVDVEWKSKDGLAQRTRVFNIPTGAGLVEITLTCGVKDFGTAATRLNWLLNTLSLNASETHDSKPRQNVT